MMSIEKNRKGYILDCKHGRGANVDGRRVRGQTTKEKGGNI